MKRTVLLAGGISVLIVAVLFFSYRNYTKSFSPEAVAAFDRNGLDVRVRYCQPAKRNRLIFGRESDGALVPYGKVWRTGANEATLVTFGSDVLVAGTRIPGGTYSIWTVPGPAEWQLIINRETGQWGTEYNDGQNLARVDIPIRINPQVTENFTVFFEEEANGANMILDWDQTEAVVPLRPAG